jgi:hypothetical protein
MEARSKEAILSKTHYGIGIYAHILRLYYPSETVLSLSGRTCSPTKNPFNADKSTLNIFIEKLSKQEQSSNSFETMPSAANFAQSEKESVLGNALDKEFARHSDSEISCQREQSASSLVTMPSAAEIACHFDTQNAIPAGDAFDFAELHYKQSGDELLQMLNMDMNLHIGENWSFYSQKKTVINTTKNEVVQVKNKKAFAFSFFKAPIKNTLPHKTVSLVQVYNAITGEYYKQHTEKLRSITDVVQARKYKAANFDYCTFSGVFTARNDKSLVTHSELMCIDFDHVQNTDTLRQALLADEYFDTQLLFVSPSGDGLKWIIEIDTRKAPHGEYFASVANYILQTYSVEVDKSGKDISRACFLPFDPNAFINPLLLNKHEQENI